MRYPTGIVVEAMRPPFEAAHLKEWRRRKLMPFEPSTDTIQGRSATFSADEVLSLAIMSELIRQRYDHVEASYEAKRICEGIQEGYYSNEILFIWNSPINKTGGRYPIRNQDELKENINEKTKLGLSFAILELGVIRSRVDDLMEIDWEKFDKALLRCLNEVNLLRLGRDALHALRKRLPVLNAGYLPESFFGMTDVAHNFHIQSRAALVLDSHKSALGFPYLNGIAEQYLDGYHPNGDDLAFVNEMVEKYRPLRNKALFHLDEQSIRDPRGLRAKIGITYDDLDNVISALERLLWSIYEIRRAEATWTQGGAGVDRPDFDDSDLSGLLKGVPMAMSTD